MQLKLSSSTLKIIAMLTMVVDHVGLFFFPQQLIFRMIGRISFPLFAFLIAEGHRRTSNVRNYLFRLMGFALISQIPFWLAMRNVGYSGLELNIFFTLFFGLMSLMVIKRWGTTYALPVVLLFALVAEFLRFDYGAYGVLFVLACALFLSGRKGLGLIALFILPFCYGLKLAYFGIFSVQEFAILSIPLMLLYSGENGISLPRRLLYWFYPAHLILIWLIWLFVY